MTARALIDPFESPLPPVWDEHRLAELRAEVGDSGLRDILRLFQADLPFLRDQLAAAQQHGNGQAAAATLASIAEAAESLGLAGLAALARCLAQSPLSADNGERLAHEAARIRCIPPVPRLANEVPR